jgi:alkanesulfonate monooxygenase SsuD/methylene tetrahydromethanopterin reductase-like flavin-dependent oxidoreductase (luciferase family)
VAKYADWCNLNNKDATSCQESLNILRGHCQKVGRNYDEIVKTFSCDCVAIAPTRAEAEAMHRASFFSGYAPMVGTSDQVADQLQAYIDLGITHFILRFADFPSTAGTKLFMREVMPRF